MNKRTWARAGIVAAVLVAAVAAGSAAFAMRGGDDGPKVEPAADRDGRSLISAECALGALDCERTEVDLGGSEDLDCPPEVACAGRGSAEPAVCPDDVPVDECFPDARPIGPYICEAPAEPSPGDTPDCKPTYCEPVPLPPDEPLPPEPPLPPLPEPTSDEPPPTIIGDPDEPVASIAVAECPPPVPCLDPLGAPCGCGPTEDCPVPCVFSSDGTEYCPTPLPCPLTGDVAPGEPCPVCDPSADCPVPCLGPEGAPCIECLVAPCLPPPCDADPSLCECPPPPTIIEPASGGQSSPPYPGCSAGGAPGSEPSLEPDAG